MNKSEFSHDDIKAMRLLNGIAVLFGILVGAVIGAIFIPQIVQLFVPSVTYLRLYCTLLGSIVGGGLLYIKTNNELHRQHAVHTAGKEIGLNSPDETDSSESQQVQDYEDRIREMIPSDGLCTVDIKFCKKLDLATLVIAEVRYTDWMERNGRKIPGRATVAYFDVPSGQWPEFQMHPEKTKLIYAGTEFNPADNSVSTYRTYRSTKGVDFVFGDHDIDFDDSPEFSENYHLLSLNEPYIRKLFTPQIREYFASHLELCLNARMNQLLIYYPRVQIDKLARDR